jgi:hypothetical protein
MGGANESYGRGNNNYKNDYGRKKSYDDDEDDPDAGHTINGKPVTPEEYRKWKDTEGEYDDMDRERYRRR